MVDKLAIPAGILADIYLGTQTLSYLTAGLLTTTALVN